MAGVSKNGSFFLRVENEIVFSCSDSCNGISIELFDIWSDESSVMTFSIGSRAKINNKIGYSVTSLSSLACFGRTMTRLRRYCSSP